MADENVFAQMAAEGPATPETAQSPPITAGEVDYEKLSNTPVGEKVKYNRVNLNGQVVTLSHVQLFAANPETDEVELTMDKKNKFYRNQLILHYDTPNKDREYLSGARQFVQRDGKLSDIGFWYKDAAKPTQTNDLWEAVAKFKNKAPEELSAKEFIGFLNSKPKAKLVSKRYQFPGSPPSDKNVVEAFVAA